MKRFTLLLMIFPALLYSASVRMPILMTPSGLEAGQTQFHITHHFYDPVTEEIFDTFFGMHGGANVSLSVNGNIRKHILWDVKYIFDNHEYQLGIGYNPTLKKMPFSFQAGAYLANYKINPDDRESSLYIYSTIQTNPLLKIVTPTLNLGHDTQTETTGFGLGANIQISKKFGCSFEYVPSTKDEDYLDKDGLSFGMTVKTYGHDFMFYIQNNPGISMRRWMQGTYSDKMAFGFKIIRTFGY